MRGKHWDKLQADASLYSTDISHEGVRYPFFFFFFFSFFFFGLSVAQITYDSTYAWLYYHHSQPFFFFFFFFFFFN